MSSFAWNAIDLDDVREPMELYERVIAAYAGPTDTTVSDIIEDLAGVIVHGQCVAHRRAAHFMYLLTLYRWLTGETPDDDYTGLAQRIRSAWNDFRQPTSSTSVAVTF